MEAGKYYKYTYGQNIAKLPILKLGSRGDYVRLLQQSISDAGFNCGTVDGQFGKKTDGAIRAYQQACGLSRDGIVGPKTWDKVLAVDVVELDISQLKAALVSAPGPTVAKSYRNFINANFFSGESVIGWLISEGKILSRRDEYKTWKGHYKGSFIIYKDGSVEVGIKLDSEIAPVADNISFMCQGFNLFPTDLIKEGFPKDVARTCDSVSIGYNKALGKVIIALRPATNGIRAMQTMKALGCEGSSIRLDSGGSANLYVDGRPIYSKNRVLTNIIYW